MTNLVCIRYTIGYRSIRQNCWYNLFLSRQQKALPHQGRALPLQSFTEFTELFAVHCCTGRQRITSSLVGPQVCMSVTLVAAWVSIKVASMKPVAISNAMITTVQRIGVKRFRICFLEAFVRFANYLESETDRLTAILVSRLPRNYLPQANSFEAIFFACIILLVLLVTPRWRRLHHFCAALAVTCKVRLCLHPRGMLRVQSLHLPVFAGLARRCL